MIGSSENPIKEITKKITVEQIINRKIMYNTESESEL